MSSNNTSRAVTQVDNDLIKLLADLRVARFSIYSLVWLFGIWGNIVVILTICKTKRLRSSSNYFIANLAVADLGALFITMPMAVIGQITDWPFGDIVCRFLNPLKDLFLHVSYITLTVIAVDRYIHISRPFKSPTPFYKVKLIIALIWLVDYLIVPLPMGFAMKIERHPLSGNKVCVMMLGAELQKIYILVLSGVLFLSFVITALAYLGIGVIMFRQRKRIKLRALDTGMQDKSLKRELEKNRKTVKLMIVIVVVFWLSVLPFILFALLLELKILVLNPTQYVISFFTVFHMLLLQHCTNPAILYLLCKEMRAGFSKYLISCSVFQRKRRNGGTSSKPSSGNMSAMNVVVLKASSSVDDNNDEKQKTTRI